MNTFKIIRKEILPQNYKLFEQHIDNLAEILREERENKKTKLPDDWIVDKHDRMLLKAVSDNGIPYLSKLRENPDYGFCDTNVSKKRL